MRMPKTFVLRVGTEYTKQWCELRRNASMPVGFRSMMHYLENPCPINSTLLQIIGKTIQPFRRVEITIAGVENTAFGDFS